MTSIQEHSELRVLALSSGGGHWIQLLRMRPAWAGCDVAYATTDASYRMSIEASESSTDGHAPRFYAFTDASLASKLKLLRQLVQVLVILLRERPDVVVTTGASAGYFALRLGKLLGSRTIWVDSIANARELSLAGRKVGPYADLWLTQWQHLSLAPLAGTHVERAPVFLGSVL